MTSNFWKCSSTDEKLKQVEAGAKLGMTARQLAICLGAKSAGNITMFASRNGISLDSPEKRSNAAKKSRAGRNFYAPKRFESLADDDLSPFGNRK